MKKTHLVIAFSLFVLGFVACKKSDSTTTTSTTSTTVIVKATTYNSFVIDNVWLPITAYGIDQANGDYSFYGLFSDSTLKTTEIRCLFNPRPQDTTKTFTIIPGAPTPNTPDVQLTLTYDQVTEYKAVSGGSVTVTARTDSTILVFDKVKFSRSGSAQKTVSAIIAIGN